MVDSHFFAKNGVNIFYSLSCVFGAERSATRSEVISVIVSALTIQPKFHYLRVVQLAPNFIVWYRSGLVFSGRLTTCIFYGSLPAFLSKWIPRIFISSFSFIPASVGRIEYAIFNSVTWIANVVLTWRRSWTRPATVGGDRPSGAARPQPCKTWNKYHFPI